MPDNTITLVPPRPGMPDDFPISVTTLRILIGRAVKASKETDVKLEDRNYGPFIRERNQSITLEGDKLLDWLNGIEAEHRVDHGAAVYGGSSPSALIDSRRDGT